MSAVPAQGLSTREQLIDELRSALEERRGFAAGKLGNTEQAILRYPLVLRQGLDPAAIRAYDVFLANSVSRHSGIFPTSPAFLRRFVDLYVEAVASLDSIGVLSWPGDADLLAEHRFAGRPIDFLDQEPDRSVPADQSRCYLPLFRGKRLLLVCPFAEVLRDRANRETFEAVWGGIGKPWFEPASVDALEFPYGFVAETRERYRDALVLLDEIRERIDPESFDVALIAAGGLAIPLAAALKAQGKVAISLGGHLQVLFGVLGERWRGRRNWERNYFNDAWVELPERCRPAVGESAENYW